MSIVLRTELCTYLFFSPFPPKSEFWYCQWVKRQCGPWLGMVGMNAYHVLGTVQDTWALQRCTGECPWSLVGYSHVWDCQGNWYLQQTLIRATVIRWEAHRRDSYVISPGPAHCKRILNSWDSGPGTRKGKWAKGIPSLGSRVNQRQREEDWLQYLRNCKHIVEETWGWLILILITFKYKRSTEIITYSDSHLHIRGMYVSVCMQESAWHASLWFCI